MQLGTSGFRAFEARTRGSELSPKSRGTFARHTTGKLHISDRRRQKTSGISQTTQNRIPVVRMTTGSNVKLNSNSGFSNFPWANWNNGNALLIGQIRTHHTLPIFGQWGNCPSLIFQWGNSPSLLF